MTYFVAIVIVATLQLLTCSANPVDSTQSTPTGRGCPAVVPDELSIVTRYAGMGYNALEANPDGDFSQSAVDPGIKVTRFIFDLTYQENRRVFYRGQAMHVPDQVEFHPRRTCISSETANAYSGQTSYKNELSLSVDASGSYSGILSAQFSLSSAMSEARQMTENRQSVIVQKTRTCSYGEVRYKLASALSGVSGYVLADDFKRAVKALPAHYSVNEYTQFLDDWGTHFIETARVGTRNINRSSASYLQVYEFLSRQNSGSASGGVSYLGASGSVSLDIAVFDLSVSTTTEVGTSLIEVTIGTDDEPVPIWVQVVPIIKALNECLWSSNELSSIRQRTPHLDRALREYATNKNAMINQDPSVTVPIPWPGGQYTLIKAASGCPTGMSSGWRYQDNEDSSNANSWRPSNIASYISIGLGGNIKTNYCTKLSTHGSSPWPAGTYCIARYGSSCPSGFFSGYIHWDDEDSNNANQLMQPVPSGNYGRNTGINYCCRSDGNHDNRMLLPPTQSFALYRYGGRCQKILGMNDPVELFVHFDDEDSSNANSCSGNRPDGPCGRNHELYFCYYSPSN